MLVDPQLGELVLDAENGYIVQEIDLGFPEPRPDVVTRVAANGARDYTMFYGPRVVSMTLMVLDGYTPKRVALDRLRAYTSPGRRPVLYFNDMDGSAPDRRIRLRGESLGSPLVSLDYSEVHVQWSAPDGVIEDARERTVAVPATPGREPGRRYPRTYPIRYPAQSATGSVTLTCEGLEPAAPLFRLWGPCVTPRLYNLTSGLVLTLPGVSVTAEQYVEVDVREATVQLQGDPGQSLYGSLGFESTMFWLQPGVNVLRYVPVSYGQPSRAEVIYRDAWI